MGRIGGRIGSGSGSRSGSRSGSGGKGYLNYFTFMLCFDIILFI